VKTIRAKTGPFLERPHFEPAEIDRICVDELRKTGLYPSKPEAVRIDRFIEKRFGRAHDYEDLPPGVLGYTKLSKTGVEKIIISSELAEDESEVARRRERATMAHEAGHGLLHAHLFAVEKPSSTLFDNDNCSGSQILCREVIGDQTPNRPKSSWSEYQANRAIGGLLLPRKHVMTTLEPYLVSSGALGGAVLDPARRGEAERVLATVFDVNPVVARIRIEDLFRAEDSGQMLL
jgi:hypothetical protein